MRSDHNLRLLQEKCIQEKPVQCSAACPFNVDIRDMLMNIAAADFDAALTQLHKKVIFPSIICNICHGPCEKKCQRRNVDDAIAINELEKACLIYGKSKYKVRVMPAKNKTAAVIGSGLSGLICAHELARKGYQVIIYEQSSRAGGSLWELYPDHLSEQVINEAISAINNLGVQILTNVRINSLSEIQYDACYITTDSINSNSFGLGLDETGNIMVDSLTLQTEQKGVFAVREIVLKGNRKSWLYSAADGLAAAASLERYIKNVSLTANRLQRRKDSSYSFKIPDVKKAKRIIAEEGGYSRAEAIGEAGRCLQCECLECVKVCSFLQNYKSYPYKYIKDIYTNVNIVSGWGIRSANQMINSCHICGLCSAICPTSLDMGEVCLEARQSLVRSDYMAPAVHDFALRVMEHSNSDKCSIIRHQPGMSSSLYCFFPGCQLGASNPEYIERTYKYLVDQIDGGVGLWLGCCGIPAYWSGREKLLAENCRNILEEWEKIGKPQIILACPSCKKVFDEHMPQIDTTTLWSVLLKIGLPENLEKGYGRVLAIHDPCASRYDITTQNDARNLLNKMDYSIAEMPMNRQYTRCCGFGGLASIVNPESARETTINCTKMSRENYITYCSNCRDFFIQSGKPSYHMLDLIFFNNNDQCASRLSPTHSQRWENRYKLKKRLLQEIWGEKVQVENNYENIQLNISKQIEEKMNKSLILADDIRQVIYYAETSGNRLYNEKSNTYIAHLRPQIITYWVEYMPEGSIYRVVNAYCHRMQIAEDV